MVQSHLRIYRGPESPAAVATTSRPENLVRVRLGQILPLLADAVCKNRTWLRDFDDEEVTVTNDLYEILMAYKYTRCPSA